MSRIILTGGISSGKSTVSKTLERHGITIIDADVLSFNIFRRNTRTIKSMFETNLKSTELRKYVGSVIFSNPLMKLKLEAFMHPKIRNLIKQRERKYKNVPHVIDMPLYFETKHFLDDDYVILLSIPYDKQLKRLIKRNNLTEDEANKRILSQLPTAIKEQKSDYIIRNSGTLKTLEKKVEKLIEEVFSIECKIN